jgi:ATPase subunit of ABC transporter with duplicated ATPase domains
LRAMAERFNQRDIGPYVDRTTKQLRLADAQAEPAKFLQAMASGTQKVMQGESVASLASDVLVLTKEIRFFAQMEGDRIGGFHDSSMTPGKQALFALTLILNESDDAWPLLIDQPEDDLDSRSVYDVLVRYLVSRKKERQILMVSHNANLVIGADSEQIVVANRHGIDRQNKDAQEFDYRTGSLEHSEKKKDTSIVLASCGIREHACELLDGGEEAFKKRRTKYKL